MTEAEQSRTVDDVLGGRMPKLPCSDCHVVKTRNRCNLRCSKAVCGKCRRKHISKELYDHLRCKECSAHKTYHMCLCGKRVCGKCRRSHKRTCNKSTYTFRRTWGMAYEFPKT